MNTPKVVVTPRVMEDQGSAVEVGVAEGSEVGFAAGLSNINGRLSVPLLRMAGFQ